MSTASRPEIDLLCALVQRRSITPEDDGCQPLLAARLDAIGFHCESMPFGDVSNLWARRGSGSPLLCFAGHTDVVPPGEPAGWATNPFEAVIRKGVLFGRGAADMKSGLAAMTVALEMFVGENPDHYGSLAVLITSDEEGKAREGTLRVMQTLRTRGVHIDWCVLGEPSSQAVLGDTIRIGRRGSLSGVLTVRGVQGHVAYPQLADNPIRRFAPLLTRLHEIEWDQGNEHFPPTSFQVVEIHSSAGAPNVTPGELHARFNLRYSTEWTQESLKRRVAEIFGEYDIDYQLDWHLSGEPFLTRPGRLSATVADAVKAVTGIDPELSTGGGTSDGRFISPAGADVVEIGPVNASIHKTNEHVIVDDVSRLTRIYKGIMERLLLTP
jgi:succinyl-diaminopimelate desuccinylase